MPSNSIILYPKDTLLIQVNKRGIYLILRNIYGYYYKTISGNKASMASLMFLHESLYCLDL